MKTDQVQSCPSSAWVYVKIHPRWHNIAIIYQCCNARMCNINATKDSKNCLFVSDYILSCIYDLNEADAVLFQQITAGRGKINCYNKINCQNIQCMPI